MSHTIELRTTDAKIVGFAVLVKDALTKEKSSPLKALEVIENT